MIETDYHEIPLHIYQEIKVEADKLSISIDYFLMEFCQVHDEAFAT